MPFDEGKTGIVQTHEPGRWYRIHFSDREVFYVFVDGKQDFEIDRNLELASASD